MQRTWPSDEIMNRWMQIKRLSGHQVSRLHSIERVACDLNEERNRANERMTDESDWRLRGINFLTGLNIELGPFWDKSMEIAHRTAEIARYRQFLFSICRPIWDKLEASYSKMPDDPAYFSEMAAVHEVDLKIHEADYVFPPGFASSSRLAGAKIKSHGLARKDALAGDAYVQD